MGKFYRATKASPGITVGKTYESRLKFDGYSVFCDDDGKERPLHSHTNFCGSCFEECEASVESGFKIGDRVELIKNPTSLQEIGMKGTITCKDDFDCEVKWDDLIEGGYGVLSERYDDIRLLPPITEPQTNPFLRTVTKTEIGGMDEDTGLIVENYDDISVRLSFVGDYSYLSKNDLIKLSEKLIVLSEAME